MSDITKTITLKYGIEDESGNKHTEVTLTEPRVEHEIRRDNVITRMRLSNREQERVEAESETIQLLALICECTIKFGGLLTPELKHFRGLKRVDANRLIEGFAELQADEDDEDLDEKK